MSTILETEEHLQELITNTYMISSYELSSYSEYITNYMYDHIEIPILNMNPIHIIYDDTMMYLTFDTCDKTILILIDRMYFVTYSEHTTIYCNIKYDHQYNHYILYIPGLSDHNTFIFKIIYGYLSCHNNEHDCDNDTHICNTCAYSCNNNDSCSQLYIPIIPWIN